MQRSDGVPMFCSAQVSPPSWEVVRTGLVAEVGAGLVRARHPVHLAGVIATTPPSASMFGDADEVGRAGRAHLLDRPSVRPASVERRV